MLLIRKITNSPSKLLVVESSISALLGFVINIIIARSLGVSTYGDLMQGVALYALLRGFFLFRISEGITWGVANKHIFVNMRTTLGFFLFEAVFLIIPILIGYILNAEFGDWAEFIKHIPALGIAALPTVLSSTFEGFGRCKERYNW